MEIFRLFGSIFINDQNAMKKLDEADAKGKQVQKTIEGVKGGFSRLGGAMKTAVVGAGVALAGVSAVIGKFGFDFNAKMEQSQIAWETLLGSADQAKTMMDDLLTLGKETPFEFEGLDQSAKLLKAMGVDAPNLIPYLTNIGDAVSAIGGNQETLQGVSMALGQMITKGKVSAEEMNQLAERGIPAWDMMAEKLNVSKDQLMKLSSEGKVFSEQAVPALIEAMGERFDGAMKKQSKTWNGMVSTLKDSAVMLAGKVMQPIFDKASQMLPGVLAAVDKLSEQVTAHMPQIQAAVDTAFSVATSVINGTATAIQVTTGFFTEHWDVIEPILIGLAAGATAYFVITKAIAAYRVAVAMATAVQLLLNGAMTANPIGIIVVAIGALVAAGVYLYKNWDTVRINMAKIWESLAYAASSAMSWIKTKVLEGLLVVIDGIQRFSKYIPGLGDKLGGIRDKISGMIDAEAVKKNNRALQHEMKMASLAVELQEVKLKKLEAANKDTKQATEDLTNAKQKETTATVNYTDAIRDNNDAQEDAKKKAEEARKAMISGLDKLGDAIMKALQKRNEQEEKSQLASLDKQIADRHAAADKKLKILEQQQKDVEKAADDEIKTQQRLTDQKLKLLDQEYEAKLRAIDAESDSRTSALQDQIDAIEGLTEAEDKAAEQQEFLSRKAELEKKVARAVTNTARKDAQAELDKLLADQQRKELLASRKEQIEHLKSQIDAEREATDEKKEKLQDEYDAKKENEENILKATLERIEEEKKKNLEHIDQLIADRKKQEEQEVAALERMKTNLQNHYAALNDSERLQAEARKLALNKNNAEMIALLKTYNPGWQNAGQSFGESLLDGLNSTKQSIRAAVDELLNLAGGFGVKFTNTAKSYVVKKGDTLSEIAKRFGISVGQLMQANGIGKSGFVEAGKTLTIPAFAKGTDFAPGGWSLLGEKGPELTWLPRGSQVKTAEETSEMLDRPIVVHSHIYMDGVKVAESVSEKQYQSTRSRGRIAGVMPG